MSERPARRRMDGGGAARHTIGRLARATGCRIQTIRYYESIGLMPKPPRTAGNQRLYTQADLDRLAFVRHARELGFSTAAIRELLTLSEQPEGSCAAADRLARSHLRDVEGRIARLEALRRELERMVDECSGGRVAECRVIEVVADASHAHCVSTDHRAIARSPEEGPD